MFKLSTQKPINYMKKILKLTLFLFLMIFSLNVYSQSSEVKKLQDKIEEWKNYDFIAHVKNSDRDAIYSKFYNKAVISGVYPQWSSYSNSRPYEYIITPQFANGNYGNTETRLITMSESYTKEGFELYKKSEIEKVFKQIDEQIELEKNQEENRKATAQKNAERKRKRGAYVKKQIELIDKFKDSILLSLESQKREFSDDIEYFKKVHQNIEHILSTYVNTINIDTENNEPHQKRSAYRITLFPTVWQKDLNNPKSNDKIVGFYSDSYRGTMYNNYKGDIIREKSLGVDEQSVLELFSGREEVERLRKIIRFVKMTDPRVLNRLEKTLQMYNNESRWKEIEGESYTPGFGFSSNRTIENTTIQEWLHKLWRENQREIEKEGLKYKFDGVKTKAVYRLNSKYDEIKSFMDLFKFIHLTSEVSRLYMGDLKNYYPETKTNVTNNGIIKRIDTIKLPPLLMKDNVIDKWNGSLINPSSELASDLSWLFKFNQDRNMITNLQTFGNSINNLVTEGYIKNSDKKSLEIFKERIIEIFTPQELKIYNIIFSMYFKTDEDILNFKFNSNYSNNPHSKVFTEEEEFILYDLIQLSPIKLGDRLPFDALIKVIESFEDK